MAELTGKAISELPESTTVNNAALVALSENGASKKMTLATLVGNLLKKTGDTMTGVYRFRGSNLDKDVAADSWSDSYPVVVDKDGDFLGNVRAFTLATGVSGVQLTGQNGSYQNYLRLGETENHEHYVAVTDQGAWRAAIGALNKAGDTMTGQLTIANAPVIVQDRSITSGTTPSSNIYGKSYYLNDSNGFNIATWQIMSLADGREGFQLVANKKVGNVNKFNYLRMNVDANGNPIVELSSSAAWRKALGLCYAVNNTFTNSYIVENGFVSNSTTEVIFTVNVPLSMENISTVTVTSLSGVLRGISGYLNSTYTETNFATASGYTVTATKRSANEVQVVIKKSSAYTNVDNNTPVSYAGAITLKFT